MPKELGVAFNRGGFLSAKLNQRESGLSNVGSTEFRIGAHTARLTKPCHGVARDRLKTDRQTPGHPLSRPSLLSLGSRVEHPRAQVGLLLTLAHRLSLLVMLASPATNGPQTPLWTLQSQGSLRGGACIPAAHVLSRNEPNPARPAPFLSARTSQIRWRVSGSTSTELGGQLQARHAR